MKFITVRDLRTKPAAIWKELDAEHEMVITNHGKPIAILSSVSEENLEERLKSIRKAAAIDALRAMQQQSLASGKYALSMDEIDGEVKRTRAQKKR